VYPLIIGLSDHDAQVITLNNIFTADPNQVFFYTTNINNHSISQFLYMLSYENWEDVFHEANVNVIFNKFLNTYLRIFYACFPVKESHYSLIHKPWLTNGIRISCVNKSKLYLTYRDSNDSNFKEYYKKYCRTLTKVITTAKKALL
jgi:hypothetical protein